MFESCRITLQWESRSDQWLFQVAGRCFPVHANWLTDFPAEVLNELSSACSSSCPSGPEPLLPIRKQLFPGFDPARNNVHVIPMLLRWIMSKGAQGSGTVLVFLLGREAIDAADAELRSRSDLWGRTKNVCAACVQQKSVGVATLWLPRSRKQKGSNGSQGLVAFSHNRDAVRCLRLRPRSDDAWQRVSDRMGK